MRWSLLLLFVLLAACTRQAEPPPQLASSDEPGIASPAALIAAMHARYDGKWYETLTFVQETIRYDEDGSPDTATWYEAYSAPGKLRIDVAPLENGNGLLFADDMFYNVQDGAVAAERPQIHALLLLGFDVYHLPPATTVALLDTLGFDMTRMHETMWQDRPHYVVGATREDEAGSRFWIDKEHLYFTRMVRHLGPDGSNVQEVQFNRYEPLGEGWIAPEVLINFDGQPVMKETYRAMRADVPLDTALFNPDHWRATHWHTD